MTLPSDWPYVLCGLIGSGIQASRTPALHAREGAEQGLRLIYRKIDLDRLGLGAAMAEADGLVNTTPVGMAKFPGTPLPPALLRPALWVSDSVDFPMETELLRAARALGCRTLDGGGMAVFQAAEAFRLFTGRAPDAERMLRHFTAM